MQVRTIMVSSGCQAPGDRRDRRGAIVKERETRAAQVLTRGL
jgi:hypothetical protein